VVRLTGPLCARRRQQHAPRLLRREGRPGEVYNLGGGRTNSASVPECVRKIETLLDRKLDTALQTGSPGGSRPAPRLTQPSERIAVRDLTQRGAAATLVCRASTPWRHVGIRCERVSVCQPHPHLRYEAYA